MADVKPSEPCKGPHPCFGCGTTIFAHEICCSSCYLNLPTETKILIWKAHPPGTPELLVEGIRSALKHFESKPSRGMLRRHMTG